MMEQFSGASWVYIVAIIMFGCAGHAIADDQPLPTVLTKRGKLILDEDRSKDRGGKMMTNFNDDIGLKNSIRIMGTGSDEFKRLAFDVERRNGAPPRCSLSGC